MRQMFREFKRAPARIVTSILALALALGAMGVFAIPAVASSSLRDSVRADRMANITFDTTDSGSVDIASAVESVPGVEYALAEVVVDVGARSSSSGPTLLPVVGRDLADTRVDVVSAASGRLPASAGEVLVTDGVAEVGDTITVTTPGGDDVPLTVVGVGGTSFWAGEQVAFSTFASSSGPRRRRRLQSRRRPCDRHLRQRPALDGGCCTRTPRRRRRHAHRAADHSA